MQIFRSHNFLAFLLLLIPVVGNNSAIAKDKLPESSLEAKKKHSYVCRATVTPEQFNWNNARVSITDVWIDDRRMFVLSFRYTVDSHSRVKIKTPVFETARPGIFREGLMYSSRQWFSKGRYEGVVHIWSMVERWKTKIQVTDSQDKVNITFDLADLGNGKWDPEYLKRMRQSGRL